MSSRGFSLVEVMIAAGVVAVLVIGGFFLFSGNEDRESYIEERIDTVEQAEEVKNLVAQLSEFIVLPEDEEPTVATVTDPELLRGQPFFENAEIGYKVLIYAKAKKAILYDPESKKIVDIAPINLD